LANQKQGIPVKSYLLYLSLAVARLWCAFSQPQQTVQKFRAKPILMSQKCEVWTFPHPILICGGHILSTIGVALVKFSCNSEKFSTKIKACYTIVGGD